METIDNYIKEALITKSNINKIANANKRGGFDIDNITALPKINFDKPKENDADSLEEWLKENDLMPNIDNIEGHKIEWTVYAGSLNYGLYLAFDFVEISTFGEITILCIEKEGIRKVEAVIPIKLKVTNTLSLLKENKKLREELQRIIWHLEDILDKKEIDIH